MLGAWSFARFGLEEMSSPLKQIAALPIVETAEGPLVLLITTRGRGRWTIPRGWPKPDMADADLAGQEAAEEAGVEGDIEPERLGSFEYTKRFHLFSWAKCRVDVYALRVRCQQLDWPEKAARKTLWVPPEEAASLVADDELSALLSDFFRQKAAQIAKWTRPLRFDTPPVENPAARLWRSARPRMTLL